ncbi:P-loop containing nucleoside triphosphate hydrolase protein [Mycena capillaripes]|nr:P-loop containing nucleoside triphosphate hydrolase protein [Mycena capillaripes]
MMSLIHSPDELETLLPVVAAAMSGSILLLHSVLAVKSVHGIMMLARVGILEEQRDTVHLTEIGTGPIRRLRLARLFGCLGLVALSFSYQNGGLARVALLASPYLYASILTLFAVGPKHTPNRLITHVNCVLFVAFCVYVYRDLFPFATFTGVPADFGQGWRLWATIALLFLTAVAIPLSTPRRYIPVDPSNPMKVPNPEQTASLFSLAFYFFLDPIVFLAYRESQLSEDALDPLCDIDASRHLINRSFKDLDSFSGSKSRRHIFWGLMRVFRREFIILAGLLVFRVLTNFSGPFAMNRLLQYIETQEEPDSGVRPWVWIALIFLGPVAGSLGMQAYIFLNTRCLVQIEAIITQLVFAHSLRIRMKAETGSEGKPLSTPGKKDAKKSGGSLIGKINNLVTVDLANIGESKDFSVLLIFIPLQLTVGIWFLHGLLGWAVWVGVASIVLLAPVPGYMAKLIQSIQKARLRHTDERVQSVSEAVNVLRMVKLFGWEEKMKARIGDKRESELAWIRKRRLVELASSILTLPAKTLIMGQPLNASKVFSSITVFDLLRNNIAQITSWLNTLVTGKVSLDRVDDFLKRTELLDTFDQNESAELYSADPADERIGFRNATFSWSKESDPRQFFLKIDGEVLFERGRINLVVGPTGAGKTSLLMALLGEMHWIPSSPDSWYNLPRGSGVAYAAQESWVLNETIRTNIIFDTPFDEERYKKVLYQCALEPDLSLFQAGDQTEVGEKGLTLSGGQKARLTLARAVVILIVHTAQWIVEKCLSGDLIENRTVILVTHNVAMAHPVADFVVTFGSDGRLRCQGVIPEILKRKDREVLEKSRQKVDIQDLVAKPADGKLIVAEEIQLGNVDTSAFAMYLFAMGGKYPFFFFMVFFGGLVIKEIFNALGTWMLGYWAKQYDHHPAEDVDVIVAIVLISTTTLAVVFIYHVYGQLRASKVIHQSLIDSVLRAPLRWLDVTPTSRVLARVTGDMRAVDDALPKEIWPLLAMIVSMMVKFGAVILYAPIFFFPGALIGALGAWLGRIYIASQLPVKRLMSNTRAPVLAHFGASIAGLVSIRAFGAQSKFSAESLVRIDRYTRAARNFYNLNRWVSIRVDILGAIFSAGLAAYLVYIKHSSAGDSGFLISMAVTFTEMLLWVVKLGASRDRTTLKFSSLERIQGYIYIEHEKAATTEGKPPAYWPASGDLRVRNLSARYSDDGPTVLHDISFHVKSGERVGIVGRTGSGKSSLTLSLLRCIPTEGSIMYDGLETATVNLDALRSSITIIPQVPELLSGSLRSNLDPFGQYDDDELNNALRSTGLFALQNEMDENRISLDSAISTGGFNLSVGQRQVLALARAIVRKSKILILDEDYATDSIIQNSLRHELPEDVSLITVAHRLQTVMDADKILVLDAGRIVEYDSPKELLKIKDGKLRALVEESGEREALYSLAGVN